LQARLIEQPSRGKANIQLIEEVAKILGIPKNDIEIISGHKSAIKVLLVRGIDAMQAVSLLRPRIDGQAKN